MNKYCLAIVEMRRKEVVANEDNLEAAKSLVKAAYKGRRICLTKKDVVYNCASGEPMEVMEAGWVSAEEVQAMEVPEGGIKELGASQNKERETGTLLSMEFKVRITDEDIDDIMVSALEGGINYWCCRAEVVGKYLGEYGSDQISRGGTLRLYDREDESVYELTKEKLVRGIAVYLENPTQSDVLEVIDHELRLDTSYVDAVVSDCMVQYALFDDIIYG